MTVTVHFAELTIVLQFSSRTQDTTASELDIIEGFLPKVYYATLGEDVFQFQYMALQNIKL